MFDTALNLWLQARATPELTTAMTLVSLAGSFPGSVAIAAVLAFGWPLMMLSLLGLADVMFDLRGRAAAKRGPPPPAPT